MCEADLSSADQVVIFKGDFACLQAINLTAFTTGDLVFIGGKKFLPVGVSSQQNVVRWNSLVYTQGESHYITLAWTAKDRKNKGKKGTKNYENMAMLMISISVVVFEMKL